MLTGSCSAFDPCNTWRSFRNSFCHHFVRLFFSRSLSLECGFLREVVQSGLKADVSISSDKIVIFDSPLKTILESHLKSSTENKLMMHRNHKTQSLRVHFLQLVEVKEVDLVSRKTKTNFT